jgi:serine/threonine-protein kinase
MSEAMIGRVVGERYRLESCLGTGGIGMVFRARHLLIEREVAIKLLRLDRRGLEGSREWFLREARAVNRVNHPNIADIYDFGETEDGLVFLVMELLRGTPLTEVIAQGPIGTATALDIVRQMAHALARAHDLGVIHRDLKPDNVFLANGERPNLVKLIDFGLARLITDGRLAAKGSVFGTPGYQSPEQARGEDAGPQSDLYSVGLILYELVTGRRPFESDDPGTLIRLHSSEAPPPPSGHLPGIVPEVERIILKLLAKELDERYHDAYHLIDECTAAREGVGPAQRPAAFASTRAVSDQTVGGERGCVSTWALRAAVFGRMVATGYPGGSGPPQVTDSIGRLWNRVAELSRIEGELQVTQAWDDNLRQRAREFVDQISRQIEELSRTLSSLHREKTKGRKEVQRHQDSCDRSRHTLSALRSDATAVEASGHQEELWSMLQAAGAEAAREQMHLDAIGLVEGKIEKWEREERRAQSQIDALRRQLERHSEQVEKDLELGRPRFSALLAERNENLAALNRTASELVEHFEARPECSELFRELESLPRADDRDPVGGAK